MIPGFVTINAVHPVLPPGIHDATMQELDIRYAINSHRKHLFEGFSRGVQALTKAGCNTIYLDGSFITAKPTPNDFDACWDTTNVNPANLDPVLLVFDNKRALQKSKYFGEFFPATIAANPNGTTFLDFLQQDKYSDGCKGIIRVVR